MPKQSLYRVAGAFLVCFTVGVCGSLLAGIDSKTWVPAGLATSTMVAVLGYGAGRGTRTSS